MMANADKEEKQQSVGKSGATFRTASEAAALPKLDFSTLIVSLSTSALYSMGLAPDPATGKTQAPNLTMARQTIDTLELLEEKTRGNLDTDEQSLLKSLLYELRLRYVEVRK